MGWRFKKRITIFPGVHINLSKSGISLNIGTKGASVTVGSNGTYVNTGIPGTGLYRRDKISNRSKTDDSNNCTNDTQNIPQAIATTITSHSLPKSDNSQTKESQKANYSALPQYKEDQPYDPKLDLSHYKYPGIDLLRFYNSDITKEEEELLENNTNRLIRCLNDFGISIETIFATVGPRATLYEMNLSPGVSVSSVKSIEDDIALAFCANYAHVIIPHPFNGTTIGIEIANSIPKIVSIESVLNTKVFADSTMELPCMIGKTITGKPFMFDLTQSPHILIAGSSGQGKSNLLHTIITSLIFKKHPSEVKLVLMDPHGIEFGLYEPITKQFLAKSTYNQPIVNSGYQAEQTLESLCVEMNERFELIARARVRNIKDYNNLFCDRRLSPHFRNRYLPYIVVIIDSFSELFLDYKQSIITDLSKLLKGGRAVGIHLVIATNRPSSDIIPSDIKSLIPTRVSFKVAEKIDSMVILDEDGAEQLLGDGDMIYKDKHGTLRLQCAFVDTPEVNAICGYISTQQGYTESYPLPEYVDENDPCAQDSGVELGRFDSMFAEAARLVVINQCGSTSLIQRAFSIGYNRAARLMDQLEAVGIVGRADGSKPRPVLVTNEEQLERILSDYGIIN